MRMLSEKCALHTVWALQLTSQLLVIQYEPRKQICLIHVMFSTIDR